MNGSPSAGYALEYASWRGRRRRRWLLRLLAALIVVAWFHGTLGQGLLWIVARWGAPRRIGEVGIAQVSLSPVPLEDYDLELRISPLRFALLTREALGWKRHAVPPGLVADGLTLTGDLSLASDAAGALPLRWGLSIDAEADVPRLRLRLPADWFNAWLSEEEGLTHRTTRGRYFLGRYRLTYEIRFDTLTIRSTPSDSLVRRAVVYRRIEGEATGRVRCWFRDGPLRARTTARVSSMRMLADVRLLRFMDGVAVDYDLRIPTLDGDFRRVAPFLDAHFSDRIREALERSFNRSRRKERLARRRFPSWIPSDLALDFSLEPTVADEEG